MGFDPVSQSVYYSGYDNKIKTVLNSLIARLCGVPWRQEVGFVYLAVR